MADIYKAYEFLNESLRLNLSPEQLATAENQFCRTFAREKGYPLTEGKEFDQLWEFFARLEPRARRK